MSERRARLSYRARWVLYWLAWLALIAFASWWLHATSASERTDDTRPRSLAARMLGPLSSFAASIQWVRADAALRAGRFDLAYVRAETALELAPGTSQGWIFLANHFVFERASIEREPDREARLRWVDAGFDLLGRGEKSARDPSEIAFFRGLLLAAFAQMSDGDRPWRGSAREALLAAAQAFDRAASAGHHLGAEFAERARSLAARAGN